MTRIKRRANGPGGSQAGSGALMLPACPGQTNLQEPT
ncbi:hypothetical protein VAR608DRAFT_2460 [Variovorax sp. HW608]|nr:hypothetical protein VAR608DRAFT_2460 [Variovorax sp. HW608]